jgi:hypothetical protein
MWTSENRAKYNRDKLRYPSDLTDAEWEHICAPCSCKRPGWCWYGRRAGSAMGDRGGQGVRPHGVGQSDHDDAGSARLFLCNGCRAQALICSCCDRGQIYCAGDCGPHARRRGQRAAGARFHRR